MENKPNLINGDPRESTEIDDSLASATVICKRAAAGDLEARIVNIDESNESLANLFHSINSMLDLADSYVRETAAVMESCSEGKFHRPILLRGIKGAYRKSASLINTAVVSMKNSQEQIGRMENERRETARRTQVSSDTVSASVDELKEISELISSNSGKTSDLAVSVAETSRTTAENIGSISAACEELAVTTSEISNQTHESATLATNVAEEMSQVQVIMKGMNDAVKKIDPVVSLIKRISNQTNLLALNATIEASRAGKAGDGFAVVAHEVKELSRTTASATEEIDSHIVTIGLTAEKAVDAIRLISDSVSRIDTNVSTINVSLEEQAHATTDIASNVSIAAQGAESISDTIGGVSNAASVTNSTVIDLNKISSKLAEESSTLQKEVTNLLEN